MSIAIGCDEAAFDLKETLKAMLAGLGHEVADYGTFEAKPVLYPDIAFAVAEDIAAGKHTRGVLLCGTGIGMAISANKVAGVRAAQCHDTYSAERARKSNDGRGDHDGCASLGWKGPSRSWRRGPPVEFEGGRSQPKISRISEYHSRRLPG